MGKNVEEYYENLEINKLMKPFMGKWNKLNSFFEIEIKKNEIVYRDGSAFKLQLIRNKDNNECYIKAKYGDSYFEGKFENNNYNILCWNNGSHWIKNGFKKFEGTYIIENENIKVNISQQGYIEFDNQPKKYEFMLIGKRSIAYHKDLQAIKGTLNNNAKNIKWDNNNVWIKQSNSNNNDNNDSNKISNNDNIDVNINDNNKNIINDSQISLKQSITNPGESDINDEQPINVPVNTSQNITTHNRRSTAPTKAVVTKSSNLQSNNLTTLQVPETKVSDNTTSTTSMDEFKDDTYGHVSDLSIKIERIDHFVHVNDDQNCNDQTVTNSIINSNNNIQKSKLLDEHDTVIINKLHTPYVTDNDDDNHDDYDWQLIDVELKDPRK